jgi:hypothetical protein
MTHVDWRDWVVLQDAYEPKLGIVKRTGTVDEETRLVWVASSPQCPKVCCTPTHARTRVWSGNVHWPETGHDGDA